MIIFWIIYILGIIATIWTFYHNLSSGYEITISELLFIIIGSLFSWIGFVILIMSIYGDETMFKKK